MMFYNGFNLLLDIIFCSIVGFITYRYAWYEGYQKGRDNLERDLIEHQVREMM